MSDLSPTPLDALVECPHCGENIPSGAYCGSCGASLGDQGGRRRHGAYAASPHESVHRAAVVTTLFPHLPHRNAHVFRQALVGGVAVVLLLAALRLYTPATVAAALLLPVLYVLYLYEVEVYEHEPVTVLLVTFVAGLVLGTAYTLVLNAGGDNNAFNGSARGPLLSGVLLPVIVQILMVLGPLLLLSRSHFDETLDGLTFGVATALGFTLAMVVSGQWHILTAPLRGSGLPTDAALRVLRAGVVAAVVNATTTGLITASLWQHWHGRARAATRSAWHGLLASVAVALLAQIGLGLVSYFLTDLLLEVVVWALVAALLLVWLRVVLHHALLEERAEHHVGPPSLCSECHQVVPLMSFCPACGAARSAAPKHVRGELSRVAP
jgi:hypothetical protein